MYLQFYGLREAPFAPTPDPKFLFQSSRHREALAQLLYDVLVYRLLREHEALKIVGIFASYHGSNSAFRVPYALLYVPRT